MEQTNRNSSVDLSKFRAKLYTFVNITSCEMWLDNSFIEFRSPMPNSWRKTFMSIGCNQVYSGRHPAALRDRLILWGISMLDAIFSPYFFTNSLFWRINRLMTTISQYCAFLMYQMATNRVDTALFMGLLYWQSHMLFHVDIKVLQIPNYGFSNLCV